MGSRNPPNPDGLATDYLWKEVLKRENLANIIENYAQIVEEEDSQGRTKKKQIFPRYHQWTVVRQLLAHAERNGSGKRYLIQHSAGSGKSNSIAWLAHQAIELKKDGDPVFDTLIVVTDRRVLDKQIRENIKQFAHVSAVVGAVTEGSQQLRQFIQAGKKIIITTVQKFPFILDEIGNEHRNRRFAIVIDEAHSSQGGRTMAKMHMVLSKEEMAQVETVEDAINIMIAARKLLPNASYFAFTATPKNKTLEMFGDEMPDPPPPGSGAAGGTFKPFHSYTMKQAIQEGFILDVLEHYTPVQSWYRLIKTISDDPAFDVKKAMKKLRRYVESQDHAIRKKAEIMIDHFHDQVLAKKKIGGRARAMVVTSGIERAMQYKVACTAQLSSLPSRLRKHLRMWTRSRVRIFGWRIALADSSPSLVKMSPTSAGTPLRGQLPVSSRGMLSKHCNACFWGQPRFNGDRTPILNRRCLRSAVVARTAGTNDGLTRSRESGPCGVRMRSTGPRDWTATL